MCKYVYPVGGFEKKRPGENIEVVFSVKSAVVVVNCDHFTT